jgi:riboflavin kinase/FMN adenylyltransferase
MQNMIRHISDLRTLTLQQPSLVTIGVFDGVHRGHQYLVERLVAEAHAAGQLAVVLTFYPHPDVLLRGVSGRYYLTSPEQKADLLLDLGVDWVVTQPFNTELQTMPATTFVNLLRQHLCLSALWVGTDFAMGYQREGNVPFLKAQGAQQGFSVRELELLMDAQAEKISSSAIRAAIQAGDMQAVRGWLGRGYALQGEVVHGEGRGRKIGFPTANVNVWPEQVLPANGIYAGWAWVGGERYMAATNVGVRPTFEGISITVEPYLLDFDRDIYGKTLTVSFETMLRPEAKFNGVAALIEQIGRDVEAARAYLTGLG